MKRRFDFRLQRVERVRAIEEQVARAERATAESQARAAEARRDEARSVLERSRTWLADFLLGRFAPTDALVAQRALDGEQRRLQRTVEGARTARAQAERLAQAHKTARSAMRALEELRARALERHRAALERLDNAALDEIAAQRTRRAAGRREEGESDSRGERARADQEPGPPASSP